MAALACLPACTAGPETYEGAMDRGEEAFAEGRYGEAADHFRTARVVQDTWEARFFDHAARGEIAEERGAEREALEHYDQALGEFQVIAVPGYSQSVQSRVEASAERLRKKLAGPG